jgi:hypothetical protein
MTEQEMMEIWQKYANPGPEHALLTKFCGEWKGALKVRMNPEQPFGEFTGTARLTMLLGGRVRSEEFQSNMGGMPFEGRGMLGFDNYTRKFWMTWNDNMSTGLFHMEGELSADGKVITFTGLMNKPVPNLKGVPTRHVYRHLDDNHFVVEGWENTGTPQEFQTMEITYSR